MLITYHSLTRVGYDVWVYVSVEVVCVGRAVLLMYQLCQFPSQRRHQADSQQFHVSCSTIMVSSIKEKQFNLTACPFVDCHKKNSSDFKFTIQYYQQHKHRIEIRSPNCVKNLIRAVKRFRCKNLFQASFK